MQVTQERWVWSLGWEDLLEKEVATYSSILAWEISWTEEPCRLQCKELDMTEHYAPNKRNPRELPHFFCHIRMQREDSYVWTREQGRTSESNGALILAFPASRTVYQPPSLWSLSYSSPNRLSGEGHGNPLQYSCLENSMDRGAWRATIHGVTKSWTWLSDWHTNTQTD